MPTISEEKKDYCLQKLVKKCHRREQENLCEKEIGQGTLPYLPFELKECWFYDRVAVRRIEHLNDRD